MPNVMCATFQVVDTSAGRSIFITDFHGHLFVTYNDGLSWRQIEMPDDPDYQPEVPARAD